MFPQNPSPGGQAIQQPGEWHMHLPGITTGSVQAGDDWAHAKAVVANVRRERQNTLEEAFQSFKMDVEVRGPVPGGAAGGGHPLYQSHLLDDDMLLALLSDGCDEDTPQQTSWTHGASTGGTYTEENQTVQTLALYNEASYDPLLPSPHLYDSVNAPPPLYQLPGGLPIPHFPPPPPTATITHPQYHPAPPPPLPPPPRQNKYAAAVGAALAFSLPDDSCAIKLSSTAGASDDAIHDRVHVLDLKLQEAMSDLLAHMAYTPTQAKAIAKGDMSSCSEVESRGLMRLLNHKRDVLNLFTNMLNETTVISEAAPRRLTADSAHKGMVTNSSGTTITAGRSEVGVSTSSGAGTAAGTGGAAGGSGILSRHAATQADCCTRLALSLETDQWLLERFRRQLSACACQLWALMNMVDPHPSRQVKDGLSMYTGKSLKQISDWFTNWRARHWKKIINNV